MKLVKIATVATAFAVAFSSEARVKFIAHGWDTLAVTPTLVLAHAEQFDKTGIDGITIALPVRKQTDGSEANYWHAPTDGPWCHETFADQVPILREIVKHPSLRSSFLVCSFSPMSGRIDWKDDVKWATWANNMRVLTRIAREGGLKGLFLDNEDYCKRLQYVHRPEDGNYKATLSLARQRGREIFSAIYKEFPDATVMPFWLMTLVQSYLRSTNPVAAMENSGGLWPAFVNGLFDVIPPSGRVVDGNEFAYTYTYKNGGYANSAVDQLIGFMPLIARENRAKYRAQLSVGFGQYIDMYTHTNSASVWYFGPINGSRFEHMRLNLTEAARCADEYVWLYGEQYSWVRWKEMKTTECRFNPNVTWEDKLPGFNRMLKDIRNPVAGLMDRVFKARATGVNRFKDAFAMEGHWQNPRCKQGTFKKDPNVGVGGTITLTGIVNGCSELPVAVNPGETWVVDMYMTGFCGETEHPTLCYQDAARKWHWDLGTVHTTMQAVDNEGRRQCSAVVHIPDGMSWLVLMLNGSQKNGETATFTDIFMARCED